MWGRPVKIEIRATPVKARGGHYTKVEVLLRGNPIIEDIPNMYPGDQLNLTLRF